MFLASFECFFKLRCSFISYLLVHARASVLKSGARLFSRKNFFLQSIINTGSHFHLLS